ncbi:LysR family transcriptional regulator [Pseudomonas aeruginosa]
MRTGTFGEAARLLRVSRPTVIRRLEALESYVAQCGLAPENVAQCLHCSA